MQENLPPWAGASAVYSRAYRQLERMAAAGLAGQVRNSRGRTVRCVPDERMTDLTEAMNKGDEETLKGMVLENIGEWGI
jgi:hypothetical protein